MCLCSIIALYKFESKPEPGSKEEALRRKKKKVLGG
jgi:hypothetical protein